MSSQEIGFIGLLYDNGLVFLAELLFPDWVDSISLCRLFVLPFFVSLSSYCILDEILREIRMLQRDKGFSD